MLLYKHILTMSAHRGQSTECKALKTKLQVAQNKGICFCLGFAPRGQSFIDGLHLSGRTEMAMVVAFCIPAKVIHRDFPNVESFFVEINLHKKKWLINCSLTRAKTISAVI